MENVKNAAICHVTRQNQYNPAGGGATKTVLLLSTSYWAKSTPVNTKNGVKLKQETILRYKYMGGVDHHDQQVSYLDKRKTVKTWKKRAFNIISRMLLNSYIICTHRTQVTGRN